MIENIILSTITTFFELLCCKFFIDSFLQKKPRFNAVLTKIMAFVIVIGLTAVVFFVHSLSFKICLVVLLLTLVVRIYYTGTFLQSFVLSGIYYGILVGIDSLTIVLIRYLSPNRYEEIMYGDSVASAIVILLCKTVLFIMVIAIRWKWSKENDLTLISNKEWAYFSYFPLFSVVAMTAMVLGFDFEENHLNLLLVIALGLVIMNYMVFYLIYHIVKRERAIQDSKLIEERTKNQMLMYRNMHDSYEQHRKRIHDYKNHLCCIEGMLTNGRLEETKEYIANLTGSFTKDLNTTISNHVVVDTVLNQKYRFAQSKGITIVWQVRDLSDLVINEEDIVSLLSNILDNAIEACDKVEGDKVIKFKMALENDQLLISAQNPLITPLKIEDNKIVTTKKNKIEHGIGLLNISTIVEKYDGTCAMRHENGCFRISILMPYKQSFFALK